MDVTYPGFGAIEVNGERFDSDVVIDRGEVTPRDKGPSRARRAEFGHTPLTGDEHIPLAGPRLVIGTGAYGRLPIVPEVLDRAKAEGVEVVTMPTAEACELLRSVDDAESINAILHITC